MTPLTREQIAGLRELLAKATNQCSTHADDDALMAQAFAALPALLDIAEAALSPVLSPSDGCYICCGDQCEGDDPAPGWCRNRCKRGAR